MIKRISVVLGVALRVAAEEEFDMGDFDMGDMGSLGADAMSEETLLAQAREDFKGMDLNGDDKLTPAEVAEYINDAEMKGEIEKFFDEADGNKDGAVELEEYEGFVKKMLADYSNNEMGGFDDFEDDEEL